MIKIRHCKEVNADHKRSCRQYAHTYHYKNTVCISESFWGLPVSYKLGLIAHEIGHILVGKINHKEQEADKQANRFFGIKVLYRDSVHGKRLQYLNKKDRTVIEEYRRKCIVVS